MSIIIPLLTITIAAFLIIWCVVYLVLKHSTDSPRIGAYIILGIVVVEVLAIFSQYYLYRDNRSLNYTILLILFVTAISSISYLNSKK
ncbi:hypothetical protein PASE110613_12580 [Paenibacillus sediminis]|uniref:Membrane protein YphA (DoxX/SURF4 family) n=1 Tax=Paenibacillus sediminis TaxID=664909 RepID=A0ABS4H534_9BACL|nr:putative membrane protein YphA (DoxX/SURF4 family) [Paenibacillus sediminis]